MTQQKRKKQGLFDAFVRALGDIIVVLRPYVLGGRVPKEPVTEARSRKEGGFVHYHYHRRSYADLCGRLADEWHHLPTVRAAIECLTLDKDVQKELQLVGFGDLANYIKTQIFDQFIYAAESLVGYRGDAIGNTLDVSTLQTGLLERLVIARVSRFRFVDTGKASLSQNGMMERKRVSAA